MEKIIINYWIFKNGRHDWWSGYGTVITKQFHTFLINQNIQFFPFPTKLETKPKTKL